MALDSLFGRRTIRGKTVYVVDDHHKALAAWALYRQSVDGAPNLITIDHHTDVYEPFLHYAHELTMELPDEDRKKESVRLAELGKLDWRSDESLEDAIGKLHHDEHIQTATLAGILGSAFCIQLSDSGGAPTLEGDAYDKALGVAFRAGGPNPARPAPPFTYYPLDNRTYVVPHDCFMGCARKPHNDECADRQALEVVESAYLEDQLARAKAIARDVGISDLEAEPYILDIDLDVFHTRKAIRPDDASALRRLIRNAAIVTIATEAECLAELWRDDPPADPQEMLSVMLEHIEQAMDRRAAPRCGP